MHRVALRNSVRAAALAASKVGFQFPLVFPVFSVLNGPFLDSERCPQHACCFPFICDSKGRYV